MSLTRMSILSVVQYVYHLLFLMLIFVMVHMELRSTVVMYFGSYDIGYAIPSLYHVCMDFNEGFTRVRRERESNRVVRSVIKEGEQRI